MIENGFDQPEAQYGCPIANTYTEIEITQILERTGFQVTSIKQDHIFSFDIENYKKYVYIKLPWFDSMPQEVFNAFEKKFGWHLLIDAKPS